LIVVIHVALAGVIKISEDKATFRLTNRIACVSGFLFLRAPFTRNGNTFDKLFVGVFNNTDVLVKLLFHSVTNHYGLPDS